VLSLAFVGGRAAAIVFLIAVYAVVAAATTLAEAGPLVGLEQNLRFLTQAALLSLPCTSRR
jgi:hypothetical protein